jgi:hypothetical protein
MPITTACGITQGFNIDCNSLRRVSGIKKVWLFNLLDLTSPIDPLGEGYVGSLELDGYTGLFFIDSKKNSHQFTSTITVTEGSVSFNQSLVLRVFVDTPEEVAAVADLTVADVVAIIQTGNGEYWIAGAENGLTATEGSTTTGRNIGEDIAFTITLTGSERLPYRMLSRGDAATTLAYLNALTL